MSELKCCPFCGGEAKLNYFGDESHIPFYQVSCSECGCKQANSIHKESVINAWNTRTPIANIVEKLEERRIEYELSSIKAPDEISTVYRKGVMRGYEYSIDLVKQEINNGLE